MKYHGWPFALAGPVLLLLCASNLAWAADGKVIFGVNGHPLAEGAYNGSIEQQISQLRMLGLKAYRVNVNPTHLTPEKLERLTQLLAVARQQDVQILLTIVIKAQDYTSESVAYDAAKSMARSLASQFGKSIPVWELGNEYDLYCLNEGASGTAPADYATDKYNVVRGLIKGMAAGLHEGSPSSLRVIQTSQHRRNPDSGFLQRLIQDGITFDITGYHYYTQDGHVRAAANGENALQVLHRRFGKPIWITEFDKAGHNGSGPNSDPDAQARVLMIAMQEIAADSRKYNVVAAYIYELLDEPDLLATKPTQAEFGILKANGAPTSASTAVRAFLESYY